MYDASGRSAKGAQPDPDLTTRFYVSFQDEAVRGALNAVAKSHTRRRSAIIQIAVQEYLARHYPELLGIDG